MFFRCEYFWWAMSCFRSRPVFAKLLLHATSTPCAHANPIRKSLTTISRTSHASACPFQGFQIYRIKWCLTWMSCLRGLRFSKMKVSGRYKWNRLGWSATRSLKSGRELSGIYQKRALPLSGKSFIYSLVSKSVAECFSVWIHSE